MKEFKKLKKFKVLVGAPHADRKNYCFEDWLNRVKTLTYGKYDVCIADNSNRNKNMKLIRKAGVDCVRVKPKRKSNRCYMAESHEAIRRVALQGNYDYLLHLETDIFPPLDIIEKLLVHQKQVAAATYMIDFGEESRMMIQEIESNAVNLKQTRNMDGMKDFDFIDGKLKRVYHAGLGCALIHKSVLEKITFRYVEESSSHPDSFFAADCYQQKIPIYLDTSILCEHRNSAWIHF